MMNTHISCLLRFLFWFLYAMVLREYHIEPKMHQVIAILATWELLIVIHPFVKRNNEMTATHQGKHHHDDLRSS
jgi:hypothetical protein